MKRSKSALRWKNIPLQTKIFIVSFFAIACFIVLVFGYFIPTMKNSLIEQKKIKLQDVVDTGISVLNKLNEDSLKGQVTAEEARERAVELIKSMRYGPEGKDYLWINDFQPKMIMHPFRSDLDGKDISDYADPTGKRFFNDMVDVCKKSGHGFVDYMWQWKDQKDKIVPKISYVKTFPAWNWIVGTGIYIEDVNEEIAAIYSKMIAIFSGISLIMIIVLFIVARAISRPVGKILDFANNLADGDFTRRIDLSQNDEFGKLGTAINTAADNLEKLISEVLVASQNLAQAVDQIASGNQNLSQRTSEQASSLEEIASTIEEATAAIRQNADNSGEANKLAEVTTKMAEEGNHVVVDAVASINEINKSSKKIEEIISLINEISFQTNLLALNAAVEAARAGEQGRGFAVVAGEVRNLAQRSANAAKEIGALIKDSLEKIGVGTDLSNRSGDALREIVASMKNVARIISEIAAASHEQKQGIDQINIAVSEMDTMTQQNAALVEETASAGEEMASQAKELQAMMERFKISETKLDGTYSMKHKELHLKAAESTGKKPWAVKQKDIQSHQPREEKRKEQVAKTDTAGKKSLHETLKEEGFEEF